MKFEAILFENTPKRFVEALKEMRIEVMEDVLIRYLKVPPFLGPAEFYVVVFPQALKTPEVAPHEWMCAVRLLGVESPRAGAQLTSGEYWIAEETLIELCKRKIRESILSGQTVQLSVIIEMDGFVKTLRSRPQWVKGMVGPPQT